MTANHSSTGRRGSEPVGERAKAKRSRGSYRRQLTEPRSGGSSVGSEAKRAAAVILEVLAGVRTPTAAALALGIRLPRYYLLEQRAVRGLVSACEPRPRGRTVSPDRRLAQLERELGVARRDLTRQQALARTTQRALGLAAAAGPSTTQTGKAQAASSGPKRRRRRPSVRALRAARLLAAGDASGENASPTVQPAVGSPAAAGPAGGGIRPAGMESSRPAMQADHGGNSHAGRPKAVGNS
jgi:hypothetical protein